jgi:putative two-component system response regulator
MDLQLQRMRLLIVDDEEANLALLRGILQRAGYRQISTLAEPREAMRVFVNERPDLLVLDLHMPHHDGFAVMAELRPHLDRYFPILVLTADQRPDIRTRALAEGAKDYLTKPFSADEVRLRIKNLLEARYFHKQLRLQNERLEAMVKERTRQLEETQIEMLVRLAKAAEYRDDETGEHVWRVARTSALLARELGLSEEHVDLLMRAARLHDVGKIGIPDGILLKPGKLSAEEFEVVKQHTVIGAHLLSGGRSPLVKMAELIALTHHERWDGTGYPRGLKGEAIPIESRILAVADTFDALTHDRVHQSARPPAAAANEIHAQSGKQFDPAVVAAFLRLFDQGLLEHEPEPF